MPVHLRSRLLWRAREAAAIVRMCLSVAAGVNIDRLHRVVPLSDQGD